MKNINKCKICNGKGKVENYFNISIKGVMSISSSIEECQCITGKYNKQKSLIINKFQFTTTKTNSHEKH